MAFLENIPDTLRSVFDDGLDEVLVFAFVFIFILLTGQEKDALSEKGDSCGILPLIVIGVLLLLFAGLADTREELV